MLLECHVYYVSFTDLGSNDVINFHSELGNENSTT